MDGDLSLAQSLGGLRIANPDGSISPVSSRGDQADRGVSVSPMSMDTAMKNGAGSMATSSTRPTAGTLASSSSNNLTTPTSTAGLSQAVDRRPSPVQNAAMSNSRETSASYAQRLTSRQSIGPTYQAQQQAQFPQYPTMIPASSRKLSSTTRPTSAMYDTPSTRPATNHLPRQDSSGLHKERSRNSMYGMLARSNSRGNALAVQSGSQTREPSIGERSYRGSQMPNVNSSMPARKSSRGMASAAAGAALRRNGGQPAGSPYGIEGGPLKSSEEWQERGAAVGSRKEIDANGNQVLKSVKKGVKDFSFGRTLGEGSYSTVMAATDRETGREYAIKVLDKRHIIKEKKVKYVNIEKDTLNRLTDHPGVVRLYYTFQDEQSLYFVLDLASSGELLGVLKRTSTFNEECTRFYAAEILDTVDYMHARGIIHRDLKPENVLLDDHMHVKITDFGTAKILELPKRPTKDSNGQIVAATTSPIDGQNSGKANSFVGTAEYVSPELLTEKKACKASDLWAFGCIVYQLLAGRPPFKAGNEFLTFQKIVDLDYTFPQGFPPIAKDLVERLLVLDPTSRLSIEHIKNHEFFDNVSWGRDLWKQNPPELKPFVPGSSTASKAVSASQASAYPPNIAPSHSTSAKRFGSAGSKLSRPGPRVIAEVPPPSQLDIEWSPVLTQTNERILKLGNLIVNTSPTAQSPNGKHGSNGEVDAPSKLSRFFGGGNGSKKRQRLVMVTSSARIIIVAAGGEDKKSKVEISLLAASTSWSKSQDSKGLTFWIVDTTDKHYTFEDPKAASSDGSATSASAREWLDTIERARDIAISQSLSTTSSHGPESNSPLPQNYPRRGTGSLSGLRTLDLDSSPPFNQPPLSDRSLSGTQPRTVLQKTLRSSNSGDNAAGEEGSSFMSRKRFSKRQSKSGLAAVF